MTNLEKTIQARVDAFAAELTGLVRQAALEQITSAFGGGGKSYTPKRSGPGRPPKAAPSLSVKPSKPGARVRRSPEQLEAVSASIAKLVNSKPDGIKAEEISAKLGLRTREIVGPIIDLLASKQISKKGQRRATTYFPGKSK